MRIFNKYIAGLLLLTAIAIISTYIEELLPVSLSSILSKVFIAVLLGVIIANIFKPDKEIYGAGIKLGSGAFLKLGIVFMGASVSFSNIVKLGPKPIIIILALMLLVVCITFMLGKVLGVSFRKKLLIAIGVCICGNSAIIASAPTIDADDEEVAMAISIITLFGVLGVILYPIIGIHLGMSDTLFGAWAGTAINDTSQVVAASHAYSDASMETAVTIKLIRNIMIVPAVLIVSIVYNKHITNADHKKTRIKTDILKLFPLFVLGFLGMATLNSFGIFNFMLLDMTISQWFKKLSNILILLALSGIGLGVIFNKMRAIGGKPFILGFAVEGILAVASIFLNMLFFK
ncbi:MAG: putative sulfate exporter family transporter [Bacteroidales bacterium]|nr:putative sulfate exporter family transporter [Bacteroidales bacterium]